MNGMERKVGMIDIIAVFANQVPDRKVFYDEFAFNIKHYIKIDSDKLLANVIKSLFKSLGYMTFDTFIKMLEKGNLQDAIQDDRKRISKDAIIDVTGLIKTMDKTFENNSEYDEPLKEVTYGDMYKKAYAAYLEDKG